MTIKKSNLLIVILVCSILLVSASLFFIETAPQKTEILGSMTPQKCPSNMVWDSDYYGGNRGGNCRHMYYTALVDVPVGLTTTIFTQTEGNVIQIQNNIATNGYTITLESGNSFNLKNISNDVKIGSLIKIDEILHDYRDCILNATKIENGTWYYGKHAFELTEGVNNTFYFGGNPDIDRSQCDEAHYSEYKESETK